MGRPPIQRTTPRAARPGRAVEWEQAQVSVALAEDTNENVREKQTASPSPRPPPVWKQITDYEADTQSNLAIPSCEPHGNPLAPKASPTLRILPSFRRKKRILEAGPSQFRYSFQVNVFKNISEKKLVLNDIFRDFKFVACFAPL